MVLAWVGALVLLLSHLGDVPLRDWDEGLVARVAEEISLRPFPGQLLPTLWGAHYLNKPPLIHGLIAAAIQLWRSSHGAEVSRQVPPEWLIRAVPAFCSSLIVPLVALVQWRLRPGDRLAAVCTAAVSLTLLPLMRHGRLAMLDGSLIAAMTLQWWALLSLPRQPRAAEQSTWGIVAGLAGSAMLLIKAPTALPLLFGACLLLACERRWPLQRWWPLLGWIGVGLLPGVLWHSWHLLERGPEALSMWGGQGFARIVNAVEGHRDGVIVPVVEVLEGGWPWLALWPIAMVAALRQRHERWGYWALGLTLLTAAAVLPLRTQLPWYSHLLWPAFAVSVGPLFAQLIRRPNQQPIWLAHALKWLPCFWMLAGALLLTLQGELNLPATITTPAGLALVVGGGLLMRPQSSQRRLGAAALVLLLWLALFGLFSSQLWLWELQENWSALEVLSGIKAQPQALARAPVLLLQQDERPSLNWYLGQELISGRKGRREIRNGEAQRLVLSFDNPTNDRLSCTLLHKATTAKPQAPDLFRCQPC
ncbi:glycosyltransferase family 39 protein [Synechococcus sp. LA31]|uniref:ArnT family glycosyltransferase n=1 Tax=Synechococcus sp. LA31 TaxID=2741953 RepID=UPI001BDC0660|nr:phospholipid carrier-dependent glycosyltransferase [Synechococcus sp. LA31]QVV67896.1 phospholipid carrier-dependent glycosyltransferase [Synechococcus sp. LA31]